VAGDRGAFDRAAAQLIALAADEPFMRAQTMNWRVPMLLAEGDLAGAERLVEEALGLMDDLQLPERDLYAAGVDLAIARERDDLARLLSMWETVVDAAHPSSILLAAVAFRRLANGDGAGARSLLDRFDFELLLDDSGYAAAIGLIGEVIAEVGTREQCQTLLARLLPGAGRHLHTGTIHLGCVNRLIALVLARLGERVRAEQHFRLAIDDEVSMRLTTWVIRTHLDLVEFYLAELRRADAEMSLQAAREAITGLDLPANEHRLAALAARL
jgi:hypothetical protein